MGASQARIIIVGLGPGAPEQRTVGAQRALDDADRIILRTGIHPGIEDLLADERVSTCDDLYETAGGFDVLYVAIAQRVVASARPCETVVFAVPGHPRVGERVVPLIAAQARAAGIALDVFDGISFVDAALNAAEIDPLTEGLQVADAGYLAATLDSEPYAGGLLGVDPTRPLLVGQLYNPALAVAVKLALARVYPDNHHVTLVRAAGVRQDGRLLDVALHDLDRQAVDHLTSLYVPPLSPLEAVRSPDTLTRIVARLRAPEGCPWDRKQSHGTLRDAILDEAYETVDAIDAGDASSLAEELGDLLLLVMMHAQIAEEAGAFAIEDVYEAINRKLIRRHPHVFGTATAETPDAVVATWEGVKAAERAAKGTATNRNRLDQLPRAMPATRKAVQVLAPRTTLQAPSSADAGDHLLAAIAQLVELGVDPERALEASLRTLADSGQEIDDALVVGGQGRRGGEEEA
jgi:tetrapyrrole methylase family protein/MazG family protein